LLRQKRHQGTQLLIGFTPAEQLHTLEN
jgi:hypothetical protein